MITPAYSPTATERVLPRMALDFTTGVLDSRVTVARALNTATITNSSGAIQIVNANLPRFDYNPVTLVSNGLLIEETRTNLLLNSLINGTSLSTQTVVVTAVSHTISFYGTGTITLSGTATATIIGTGAYPNRRTLTFTPTAGALICTVTGSVQYAQLEVGAFVTSFIPSGATSVTRNADVVTMTGANFSSWYNQTEGTFVVEGSGRVGNGGSAALMSTLSAPSRNISPQIDILSTTSTRSVYTDASMAIVANISVTVASTAATNKYAAAVSASGVALVANGGAVSSSAITSVPTPTLLSIGGLQSTQFLNGYARGIRYYPIRLTNAQLQAFSK